MRSTVRTVVAAVSGDWSAVEDMTQECFLRAYRKLDTLQNHNRVAAWLAGFARQVARERRRTLRRDHLEFGSQVDELAATDGPPKLDTTDHWEQVLRRLAEIPEDERLAIHAYFFHQQNAAEAATQLDLSRSGFYALLQRALSRLATRPQPSAANREAKN